MDLIWSLGLIVVVLLAFNQIAGGRASNVLRPVSNIVTNLLTMVFRAVVGLVSSIFRIGAASVKLPKPGMTGKDSDKGPGPPPPRWD
jgi:hypothetical protein